MADFVLTVKVSQCRSTINEIRKLGLMESSLRGLAQETGYYCLIIGDMMYYDSRANANAWINILVNDRAPLENNNTNFKKPYVSDSKSKNITYNVPEALTKNTIASEMPQFGFTISDNYNITQVNVSRNIVGDYLAPRIINFWGMDGLLHTGDAGNYSHDKVQEIINKIAANGYYTPLLVECDNQLKPTYFTYIFTLYKLLNINKLPLRVVCYKDFRYLEILCPPLYAAMRGIPSNKYYFPEDSIDYSNKFIWNFSDKRAWFDRYKNKGSFIVRGISQWTLNAWASRYGIPKEVLAEKWGFGRYEIEMPDRTYRLFNRNGWNPIYYLIQGKTEQNDKLVLSLKNYNPVTIIRQDRREDLQEFAPDALYASSYLKGYEKVIDTKDKDSFQRITASNMGDFEVYASATKLDPALLPLAHASYYDTKSDTDAILKKFDADIVIAGHRCNSIIGYDNLHNLVNKDQIKVKYVRHKD